MVSNILVALSLLFTSLKLRESHERLIVREKRAASEIDLIQLISDPYRRYSADRDGHAGFFDWPDMAS